MQITFKSLPLTRFIAPATLLCALASPLFFPGCARALTPKKAPLMTRFAAQVDMNNPLPEYPRPQLVRSQWQNLNGIWEYQPGKANDAMPTGKTLASEICVPFPVEAALSGVMEHHDRLWYRRTFTVPSAWKGQQLMLNFGAVDYEAEVFVNGQSVGTHTGGYEQFSYDISPYLKNDGPQELIVRVFDPTDLGGQPRGKQTLNPQGIMYTPTTGIWQTVWLEPVAKTSIQNLHMVPDIDNNRLVMTVNAQGATPQTRAVVTVKDGGKIIQTVAMRPGVETAIPMRGAKLWSPDNPFLYDVSVALGDGITASDRVDSYFGMRKISVGLDDGTPKLMLNNRVVFQMGPLDQGYWPDGNLTAPTDAALKYDLEMTKKFGFNMVRKHIKVEPARWYYHADKLGLMVWQDMPSPNSYTGNAPPIDKPAFQKQLDATIKTHWNSPAIVMWVIFNENQARHDTIDLVRRAQVIDPSRLVNRDSGGGYERGFQGESGDIDDVHAYPPPASPGPAARQALACGEYGGIGYVIKGHTWKSEGWGYTSIDSAPELQDLYGEFAMKLKGFRDNQGMSAAVYTQITDVEIETNGLMTYDRLVKCDPAQITLANRFAYPVPTYLPVVATADVAPQTWKFTFEKPAESWTSAGFNDAAWRSGQSVFGSTGNGLRIATAWTSDDIWMRRTFNVGNLSAAQIGQLVVRQTHDDDLEVFINGVLAFKTGGANSDYENKAISDAARATIRPNAENILAVHCHEGGGDQHVDVGLSLRVAATK